MANDAKRVIELLIRARNEIGPAVKGAQKDLDALSKTARGIGVGLAAAGAAGVAGIAVMVAATIKAGDELQNLRARTGLAAETLSQLKFVADQNESSLENMANALKFVAINADGAAKGVDAQAAAAFKRLGVNVRDARGELKSSLDIFLDIVDGLKRVETQTERTSLQQQLLGRGSQSVAGVLKLTRSEIEATMARARELNLVMTDEQVDAADELGDSISALKEQLAGLARTIAVPLLSSLNDLVKKTQEVTAAFTDWARENPGLGETILKISTALIGAGGLLLALGSIVKILPIITTGFRTVISPIGLAVTAVLALAAATLELHAAEEKRRKAASATAAGVAEFRGKDPELDAMLKDAEDLSIELVKKRVEAADPEKRKSMTFSFGKSKEVKDIEDTIEGLTILIAKRVEYLRTLEKTPAVDPNTFVGPNLPDISERIEALKKQIEELQKPQEELDLTKQLRILETQSEANAAALKILGGDASQETLRKYNDLVSDLTVLQRDAIEYASELGDRLTSGIRVDVAELQKLRVFGDDLKTLIDLAEKLRVAGVRLPDFDPKKSIEDQITAIERLVIAEEAEAERVIQLEAAKKKAREKMGFTEPQQIDVTDPGLRGVDEENFDLSLLREAFDLITSIGTTTQQVAAVVVESFANIGNVAGDFVAALLNGDNALKTLGESFKRWAIDVVASIASVIVKMLALRALIAIIPGGSQLASFFGIFGGGIPGKKAGGGVIRGGVPGVDSVPILGQQGEGVLPKGIMDQIARVFSLPTQNPQRRAEAPAPIVQDIRVSVSTLFGTQAEGLRAAREIDLYLRELSRGFAR